MHNSDLKLVPGSQTVRRTYVIALQAKVAVVPVTGNVSVHNLNEVTLLVALKREQPVVRLSGEEARQGILVGFATKDVLHIGVGPSAEVSAMYREGQPHRGLDEGLQVWRDLIRRRRLDHQEKSKCNKNHLGKCGLDNSESNATKLKLSL